MLTTTESTEDTEVERDPPTAKVIVIVERKLRTDSGVSSHELSFSVLSVVPNIPKTGRQVRLGKAGGIPSSLRPILERLGLEPDAWCDLVQKFGRLLKRAAGSPANLAAEATGRGQSWLQAPGRSAFDLQGN